MTRRIFLLLIFIGTNCLVHAQKSSYKEAIRSFQQEYMLQHEVVKGAAKNNMRFFRPNAKYNVAARFEKLTDTVGLIMKTSGTKDKTFYRYGKVIFTLGGAEHHLTLYQSKELLKDSTHQTYLFLPFTDVTSGAASYGGGRYLDLEIGSIVGNAIRIDFNKAYNPYCAYASGYNCPIPPRENHIPVAIRAGEKAFAGKHID